MSPGMQFMALLCVLGVAFLIFALVKAARARRAAEDAEPVTFLESVAETVRPAPPRRLADQLLEEKRYFEAADKEAADRAEAEKRARELSGAAAPKAQP